MSKVLLVDTNFSSGPIHDALLRLGHEVHVVGNRPDDFLAKISGHYWNFDYSDTRALAALIEEVSFDYLVPGCTDRSYLSCVAVNDGRFPGIDQPHACQAVFDKSAFRQLAEELDLPVPRRITDHQTVDPDRQPVIVKPVDGFSGRGITILHETDDTGLQEAVNKARAASPSQSYLIEELVEGQLHSHSAFLEGGKVVHDFLVREDSSVNPFVVDTSRLVQDVPQDLLRRLRGWIEHMASHLSLADGLLHTQFICDGEQAFLIETTRRCPGDLYSQLIQMTTGFDYAHAYALAFLGESPARVDGGNRFEPILRHTMTLPDARTLAYIHFKSALQIERWVPLSRTGDMLYPSPRSRIGILFCRANDFKALDLLYQQALHRDLYEVRS